VLLVARAAALSQLRRPLCRGNGLAATPAMIRSQCHLVAYKGWTVQPFFICFFSLLRA
jgi:hypothetical protein